MSSKNEFTPMEIDAIGEILNISLGASATAVSTMLNTRVDITTPRVSVVTADEFSFANLQPAIGVEITYVSGLDGKNIMLLKRGDIKVIIELLMGMEIPDEEFELDEMNLSAVCEVMNQMMGSSSTALSEFLGKTVNISTPISFEISSEEEFKTKYFLADKKMVVVDFMLRIDEKLESEFVNVMSTELAKELLGAFLPEEYLSDSEEEAPEIPAEPEPQPVDTMPASGSNEKVNQEDADRLVQEALAAAMGGGAAAESEKAPVAETAPVNPQPVQPMPSTMDAMPQMGYQQPIYGTPQPDPMLQQQLAQQQMLMQQMMQQMQSMQNELQSVKKVENKTIKATPANYTSLNSSGLAGEEQQENLDLIMGVSLEVSVEIGRTQGLVKDILEYSKGTLVVLDKLAGDPVDLYVNGRCIARGDVVVVDDNFGIRISEIMKKPDAD